MAKDDVEQTLGALFEAERKVRSLHVSLADKDPGAVLDAVERAMKSALAERDEDEASLRLERLAVLVGEFDGARAVDVLIDILSSDLPGPREAAGEQLEGLAFDRFKEVAKGIERALKRLPTGSPALPELPYLLAEVPEPGVLKLLEGFLLHEDPDAVAAAIEVGVTIGDPSIIRHLKKLEKDTRTVEMSNEEDEQGEVTLGELALDAIDLLEGMADEEDDAPSKSERPN
jgi:hypothetical protein